MNVLLLSPYPERLEAAIAGTGDEVTSTCEQITAETLPEGGFDFVVSYGYRYMIGPEVIAALPERIINLHVSFLPWNRGSDPNFWSFFDATPKGVSIHRIDRGLDTGPVLAQEHVLFGAGGTLASTYAKLCWAVEALFAHCWPQVRSGLLPVRAQQGAGSYHRSRDKDPFFARLPAGWDTPIAFVEDMGRQHRARTLEMEQR